MVDDNAPTRDECLLCRGTGEVSCAKCEGKGELQGIDDWITCDNCQGQGAVTCPRCKGTSAMAINQTNDNVTPDELAVIRARRSAVNGFEHRETPGVLFDHNGLAELGPDGKWKFWDMRSAFSKEACQFIAHAATDIDTLLSAVELLTAENAAMRAELIECDANVKYFETGERPAHWAAADAHRAQPGRGE